MEAHVVAMSLGYGTALRALLPQSEQFALDKAAHEQRASLRRLKQMCHIQLVQLVLPYTDWLLPGNRWILMKAAIVEFQL